MEAVFRDPEFRAGNVDRLYQFAAQLNTAGAISALEAARCGDAPGDARRLFVLGLLLLWECALAPGRPRASAQCFADACALAPELQAGDCLAAAHFAETGSFN